MPVDVRLSSLAGGRELLTGFFRDTGPQQLPDRPFRIVIHDGFYHAKLGVYTWQELNLQVRYTLRHDTGEIDIVAPGVSNGIGSLVSGRCPVLSGS